MVYLQDHPDDLPFYNKKQDLMLKCVLASFETCWNYICSLHLLLLIHHHIGGQPDMALEDVAADWLVCDSCIQTVHLPTRLFARHVIFLVHMCPCSQVDLQHATGLHIARFHESLYQVIFSSVLLCSPCVELTVSSRVHICSWWIIGL